MDPDYIGYAGRHPGVRWPQQARLAISLAVHFVEGAERSPFYGDEVPEGSTNPIEPVRRQRDLGIESLFEYGSRCGVWRILRIFDQAGVRATFFCAGRALERNPLAAQEIKARGHEIAGHGFRWLPYHGMSKEEEKEDIQRARAAIETLTGSPPLGWHSRAASQHTRGLLAGQGFLYDSDSYDDDLPYRVEVNGQEFLTIPYTVETSDIKFWPPPMVAGFSRPDDFFDTLKAAFQRLYAEGKEAPKMLTVSLRLRISGHPSRANQVMRFLEYAAEHDEVWFARRIDIARWWLKQPNPGN